MVEDTIDYVVDMAFPDPRDQDSWQPDNFKSSLRTYFNIIVPFGENVLEFMGIEPGMKRDEIVEQITAKVREKYDQRVQKYGPEMARWLMSVIVLRTLDSKWKEHLYTMDHLKDSVGLRAYGQKDPLQEYQREGYALFEDTYQRIQYQSVSHWFHVEITREEPAQRLRPAQPTMYTNRGDGSAPQRAKSRAVTRPPKVGRNDPCPCGSGKKYKKCCMMKEQVAG